MLANVQATPDLDPDAALAGALTTALHWEVAAMNRENFIVRMQLEAVERFRRRESWERLTASDVEILQRDVAGLPGEIETDDIESRLFDLTALKMQLAFAEGDTGAFERHRRRVVEIAMLLEEKSAIARTAGRCRLRGPVSGVVGSLPVAEAEATNHPQREHTALAV